MLWFFTQLCAVVLYSTLCSSPLPNFLQWFFTWLMWLFFTKLYAVVLSQTSCSDSLPDFMRSFFIHFYAVVLYQTSCSGSSPDFMQWFFTQLYAVVRYTALYSVFFTQLYAVVLYSTLCSGSLPVVLHLEWQWAAGSWRWSRAAKQLKLCDGLKIRSSGKADISWMSFSSIFFSFWFP